ncbi:MAG: Flp pilus assembly protein CpaB [Deltaproteobacteria bacterium]|nr:Flp pilus assembly protein CpaB [Deltaproteobacteria bacterium]
MSGYFADARRQRRGSLTVKLAIACSFSFFIFTILAAFVLLRPKESGGSIKESIVALVDPSAAKVTVLIPAQTINAGAALEPLMFRVEERPKGQVLSRVVTSFDQLRGLYAKEIIPAHHPLHLDYTTSVKPVNVVTEAIPDGYRGVTIRVDERSGIEGWARPGSRVDVAWTTQVRGKAAIAVIVQNSLVISAGRNVNGDYPADAPAPQELTLLVTKEDARRIILAQQTGSLSLALRGMFDGGKGSTNSILTTDDLLGIRSNETQAVRIIVVGVENDYGIYEYFKWENQKLIPTTDRGTLF